MFTQWLQSYISDVCRNVYPMFEEMFNVYPMFKYVLVNVQGHVTLYLKKCINYVCKNVNTIFEGTMCKETFRLCLKHIDINVLAFV